MLTLDFVIACAQFVALPNLDFVWNPTTHRLYVWLDGRRLFGVEAAEA